MRVLVLGTVFSPSFCTSYTWTGANPPKSATRLPKERPPRLKTTTLCAAKCLGNQHSAIVREVRCTVRGISALYACTQLYTTMTPDLASEHQTHPSRCDMLHHGVVEPLPASIVENLQIATSGLITQIQKVSLILRNRRVIDRVRIMRVIRLPRRILIIVLCHHVVRQCWTSQSASGGIVYLHIMEDGPPSLPLHGNNSQQAHSSHRCY